MNTKNEYMNKLCDLRKDKLYSSLSVEHRENIDKIATKYRFSFQEFKSFTQYICDINLWQKPSLIEWWLEKEKNTQGNLPQVKKKLFKELSDLLASYQVELKEYKPSPPKKVSPKLKIETKHTTDKISGLCPVASDKTVCCNLRTIDVVQNCGFGCSYCSIQSFYEEDEIIFESNLDKKLSQIPIDPERFYHFGSGQSSDALLWGNKENILTHLFNFATKHPNILLELKTKSANTESILNLDIPGNVVVSWSLNPEKVILNEEHLTASLESRLNSARIIANHGVKVAFHFHPLIYYQGWDLDYQDIAHQIMKQFRQDEVLFISMGSLTLPKTTISKIRLLGHETKVLQMPMVSNPEGKLTYPDEIKHKLFQRVYESFQKWHDQVFFYLCMEEEKFWQKLFGFAYPTNDHFEQEFGKQVTMKLNQSLEPIKENT